MNNIDVIVENEIKTNYGINEITFFVLSKLLIFLCTRCNDKNNCDKREIY